MNVSWTMSKYSKLCVSLELSEQKKNFHVAMFWFDCDLLNFEELKQFHVVNKI